MPRDTGDPRITLRLFYASCTDAGYLPAGEYETWAELLASSWFDEREDDEPLVIEVGEDAAGDPIVTVITG